MRESLKKFSGWPHSFQIWWTSSISLRLSPQRFKHWLERRFFKLPYFELGKVKKQLELGKKSTLIGLISVDVPVQREGPCEANWPFQGEPWHPRHLFQVRLVRTQGWGLAGQVANYKIWVGRHDEVFLSNIQAGFYPVPSSFVRWGGRACGHLGHSLKPHQEFSWLLLL